MKQIIMMGVLILSNFAMASEAETVKLSLNLNLSKLCSVNSPICSTHSSVRAGGEEVVLHAIDGDVICDDEGCSRANVSSYKGIWSDVIEVDGLRAIAIVTIEKYSINIGGVPIFTYSIIAEILGDKGLTAKMSINTRKIKDLNGVTLDAPIVTFYSSRYQPSLYIGPALDIISSPCSPTDENCSSRNRNTDEYQKSFLQNEIELSLGTIR